MSWEGAYGLPVNEKQREVWRLVAGELDTMVTSAWKCRRLMAQAGMRLEVGLADGFLNILHFVYSKACRKAGYEPPPFPRIPTWDEEADTEPGE